MMSLIPPRFSSLNDDKIYTQRPNNKFTNLGVICVDVIHDVDEYFMGDVM